MELSQRDKSVLNCVFNPNLPLGDEGAQELQLPEDFEDETPQLDEVKKMEVKAVQMAENGELLGALNILDEAIEKQPNKASLYNNRAHVYQFQRRFEDALSDLQKAIELATDTQKKTLCHAHTQRGVLYRKDGKLDLAREDFEVAARLGSKFAKTQLVELNPYAALCNQMLRKVMKNL